MEPLTMGRLAKRVEVNPETLRYYEREGLLSPQKRLSSGYRIFSEASVDRVQFIKRAQSLGFSLREIKELLSLRLERTGKECARVKRLAGEKILEVDRKIEALVKMRDILNQLEKHCPGSGPLSDCPIIDSLSKRMRSQPGPKTKVM